MIKLENHIGNIVVTENYLKQLVEHTVCSCFGVAGICPATPFDSLLSKICPAYSRNGIILYTDKNGSLIIDLHIAVAFGTNINTIAKSVAHKVKFAVSQSVRNSKCRVNIFIDDITS